MCLGLKSVSSFCFTSKPHPLRTTVFKLFSPLKNREYFWAARVHFNMDYFSSHITMRVNEIDQLILFNRVPRCFIASLEHVSLWRSQSSLSFQHRFLADYTGYVTFFKRIDIVTTTSHIYQQPRSSDGFCSFPGHRTSGADHKNGWLYNSERCRERFTS